MALESMCMLTEPGMKDNGRMTCRMDMVLKSGLMDPDMRECMLKERSMAKVNEAEVSLTS
jgi:hypothetical protein